MSLCGAREDASYIIDLDGMVVEIPDVLFGVKMSERSLGRRVGEIVNGPSRVTITETLKGSVWTLRIRWYEADDFEHVAVSRSRVNWHAMMSDMRAHLTAIGHRVFGAEREGA
jgi:hypothetical protein